MMKYIHILQTKQLFAKNIVCYNAVQFVSPTFNSKKYTKCSLWQQDSKQCVPAKTQLHTKRKIPGKFQRNPSSRLGGVVVTRFGNLAQRSFL